MPTLKQWAQRTSRKILVNGGTPPPLNEIVEDVVEGIRIIQDRLPIDAFKDGETDLILFHEYTMAGTSYILSPSANLLKVISLQYEESDGEYGKPLTQVSPKILADIKRREDYQEQDSTNTRIYSVQVLDDSTALVAGTYPGWDLYPTPVDDRTVKLGYMLKVSVTSTMTLPAHLQHLPVYYASGMTTEFELELRRLDKKYRNLYGLEGAQIEVTGELYVP